MKKILFTATLAWATGLLLNTPPVAAQAPTFDRAVACASGQGPGWGPKRTVVDGQGNVFATGGFANTTLVGNTLLTAAGSSAGVMSEGDIFLTKINATGAYAWAVGAGGTLHEEVTDMAIDATGDIVVTGYFESYRMAFGSNGPVLFNSSARKEAFVAKYSGQTGQCQWARRAGGPRNDGASAVAVNAVGEVYLAGWAESSGADFGPYTLQSSATDISFIAKLNQTGTWLWVRHVGTELAGIESVSLDSQGFIYIAGWFDSASSLNFGSTLLTTNPFPNSPNSTGGDVFVAKCTESGTWIWAVQGDGATRQNLINGIEGGYLAHDHLGHLYLCGSYRGTSVRFGSHTLPNLSIMYPPVTGPPVPYTNNYASDAFVAKLDASTGTWQWAVRTGGGLEDDIGKVVADRQGRVYVGAGLYNKGEFDSPIAGGTRSRLAQLDGATGTWRWSLPADSVVVRGLALDGMGQLWTAGCFTGTQAAFGPTVLIQAGTGLKTGYLARLGAGPLPLATALSVARPPGLNVWPNPGDREVVWVEGPAPGQVVAVFDVLGRRVGGALMPASGRLRLAFAAPLPAGVYVVRGGGQACRLAVE